jgi:hypothetical protein
MNDRLKDSKLILNEGKEEMRKNNKAWRSKPFNSKQAFIHLCQN